MSNIRTDACWASRCRIRVLPIGTSRRAFRHRFAGHQFRVDQTAACPLVGHGRLHKLLPRLRRKINVAGACTRSMRLLKPPSRGFTLNSLIKSIQLRSNCGVPQRAPACRSGSRARCHLRVPLGWRGRPWRLQDTPPVRSSRSSSPVLTGRTLER